MIPIQAKNILVSISASGSAAVLVALIAGITLLGLYGGDDAKPALNVLAVLSGMIGMALVHRIRRS